MNDVPVGLWGGRSRSKVASDWYLSHITTTSLKPSSLTKGSYLKMLHVDQFETLGDNHSMELL